MSRGLLPISGGVAAVAICPRCHFKVQYDSLRQDPNTKVWVCEQCVDIYDPWRLPARAPENITLEHPRSEQALQDGVEAPVLVTTEDEEVLDTESKRHIRTEA